MKLPSLKIPSAESARLSPIMAGTLGALAFISALAAGFAIYALLGPQQEATQTAVQDWKPPTLAIVELPAPKSPSADLQTLSRPIFSKDRKPSKKTSPPVSAQPAIEATDAVPVGLTLAAIVKNGGVASAFIISATAPEGEWKKVGESVDSWTVEVINDLDLTLKNGSQAVKLRLFAESTQ